MGCALQIVGGLTQGGIYYLPKKDEYRILFIALATLSRVL